MKFIILAISSLSILSCINSGDGKILSNTDDTLSKNENVSYEDSVIVDEYFNDPIIKSYTSLSDTLIVAEDCVIFLWPDSLDIEEIKIKHPNGYTEILEDMIYYSSEAAIALDGAGIKNFFCDKSVLLLKNNKKDICLTRKKVAGNMILFKYGEKPVISYAVEFDINLCTNFFAPKLVEDTLDL